MLSKATLVLALFAAAKLAVATPPACLLGAINTQTDPTDMKNVCVTHVSDVQDAITKLCGANAQTAQSALADTCKNAGYTVSATISASGSGSGSSTASSTASGSSTGSSTVRVPLSTGATTTVAPSSALYTSTYFDSSCSCTKTAAIINTGVAGSTALATVTLGAPGSGSGANGGSGSGSNGTVATAAPSASQTVVTGAAAGRGVVGGLAVVAIAAVGVVVAL